MNTLKSMLLVFFFGLVFFLFTAPGNHSEAEDAFHYAKLIEAHVSPDTFNPRHLLYIPAEKGLFDVARCLGYRGRSYYLARFTSMVCGALSLVLFFRLVTRLLDLCGASARFRFIPGLATCGLLFSYGFWRYACETEIYIPAISVALLSILLALNRKESAWLSLLGMIAAAGGILLHVINAIPCLIMIPMLLLLVQRRDMKWAIAHFFATALLVIAVYGFVQATWGTYLPYSATPAEQFFRPGTLIKAAIGFGQCLLSGNFLFAFPVFGEKLQHVFPYRMLAEEIFMGNACPLWIRYLASLTFVAALISFATFLLSVRLPKPKPSFLCAAVWFVGVILPTLALEPSNPELWIFSLVPLWIMFALSVGSVARRRSLSISSAVALVVAIGLHNAAGGIALVYDKNSDYNYRKAEWLLSHAGGGDTVNTAGAYVFVTYLSYWSQADVVEVNLDPPGFGKKRTFVLGDVFTPAAFIAVRYPDQGERVNQAAASLRPLCHLVHPDEFGGVWALESKEVE